MQKSIKLLSALLAAQLLLAFGVAVSSQGIGVAPESGPLVTVARDEIDRIILEGADQNSVSLARQDGTWKVSGEIDFPADPNRVGQLLDSIAGLETGVPVATSEDARERFRVSDDAYERRITLASGDKTLTRLYLGTSPGVRRVLARVADQDAIHSVKMAAYDVPVKNSGWEDKSVLQLQKMKISTIEIDGLRLQREPFPQTKKADDNDTEQNDAVKQPFVWKARGLQDGRELNPVSAEELAGILAELRFERVLGREEQDAYGLGSPLLELTLSTTDGEDLTYRLGKSQESEEYNLKVSSRPEIFRLPGYTARSLLEAAERSQLLSSASPDSTENGSEQTLQ